MLLATHQLGKEFTKSKKNDNKDRTASNTIRETKPLILNTIHQETHNNRRSVTANVVHKSNYLAHRHQHHHQHLKQSSQKRKRDHKNHSENGVLLSHSSDKKNKVKRSVLEEDNDIEDVERGNEKQQMLQDEYESLPQTLGLFLF